jgi:hypothetical protein
MLLMASEVNKGRWPKTELQNCNLLEHISIGMTILGNHRIWKFQTARDHGKTQLYENKSFRGIHLYSHTSISSDIPFDSLALTTLT